VDSKILLQQNPPVLNWGCRVTQADLYNGNRMVLYVCISSVLRQRQLDDRKGIQPLNFLIRQSKTAAKWPSANLLVPGLIGDKLETDETKPKVVPFWQYLYGLLPERLLSEMNNYVTNAMFSSHCSLQQCVQNVNLPLPETVHNTGINGQLRTRRS